MEKFRFSIKNNIRIDCPHLNASISKIMPVKPFSTQPHTNTRTQSWNVKWIIKVYFYLNVEECALKHHIQLFDKIFSYQFYFHRENTVLKANKEHVKFTKIHDEITFTAVCSVGDEVRIECLHTICLQWVFAFVANPANFAINTETAPIEEEAVKKTMYPPCGMNILQKKKMSPLEMINFVYISVNGTKRIRSRYCFCCTAVVIQH